MNKQHVAATEFLSEAENHDDTAALCLAHRALGTTYFTMGEFSAARKQLYDPDHHLRFRFQYGQDIGTTVLRVKANLLLTTGRGRPEEVDFGKSMGGVQRH